MKKKIVCLAMVLCLVLAACSQSAPASSAPAASAAAPAASSEAPAAPAWPEPGKTLTIVVNYAAGNTHDIMVRTMEPFLEKELGIDIVIENAEGGSGLVGLQKVQAMPSDGYTLVTWSNPKHDVDSVKNSTNPEPLYSYDDWAAIGSFNIDRHLILVPKESPFNTLQELIDYAKAHPGELNWSGTGTAPGVCSLGMDAFAAATGTEFTYVPYSGGNAEVVTALLGNHTDVACLGMSGVYSNYVVPGEMKALALIAAEQSEHAEGVATVQELTGKELPAYAGSACRMIMIKADTDPAIIETIRAAVASLAENQEFIDAYTATGAICTYVSAEECEAIRQDTCTEFEGK